MTPAGVCVCAVWRWEGFMSFMSISTDVIDVFLSHDWREDEMNRDNHYRVEAWFDEDRIQTNIVDEMIQGIDKSKTVACLKLRPIEMDLGDCLYVDFTTDDDWEANCDELARRIRAMIEPQTFNNNNSNNQMTINIAYIATINGISNERIIGSDLGAERINNEDKGGICLILGKTGAAHGSSGTLHTFLDCAGFDDTCGFEEDIAISFSLNNMISTANEIVRRDGEAIRKALIIVITKDTEERREDFCFEFQKIILENSTSEESMECMMKLVENAKFARLPQLQLSNISILEEQLEGARVSVSSEYDSKIGELIAVANNNFGSQIETIGNMFLSAFTTAIERHTLFKQIELLESAVNKIDSLKRLNREENSDQVFLGEIYDFVCMSDFGLDAQICTEIEQLLKNLKDRAHAIFQEFFRKMKPEKSRVEHEKLIGKFVDIISVEVIKHLHLRKEKKADSERENLKIEAEVKINSIKLGAGGGTDPVLVGAVGGTISSMFSKFL
eukprot:gene16278-22175_t